MKKLVLLFAAMFLTAFCAKTFAQGTGIAPEVGSVHNYEVNAGADSYVWTVTEQASPGGTNVLDGSVASTLDDTSNDVDITWLNPSIGTIYYVHVDVTIDGCTNHKVIAVQPVNNFMLNIVNVDISGTNLVDGDSTDYTTCAPEITTINWNGSDPVTAANSTDFTYDYGTVVFYYKISAKGINVETTDWTPEFTIEQVAGADATVTIDSIVGGSSPSGTWETTAWAKDGSTTISPKIPAGAGNDVLWIRITVANGTTNENLADNVYTIELTGGEDENSNGQQGLGNTSTIQTQAARPTTGDIITTN